MLSNCACGSPVEIEAGEDGGLIIVCGTCDEFMISLSDDREYFTARWNQSVSDRTNKELAFIGSIRGLMNE